MTREEFKTRMSSLIDSIIDSERELSDDDENALNDNLGEAAQDILDSEVESDDAPSDE